MQPRHNGQLGDWMCAMELHYKRPAESNCFKLFHGFIFHKDILIKSRIGMLRNVKKVLARCLHWVLHWVNLFWWRDLCQPDPGHNWSPHLPHLTDILTPSDTEYPCVAAQGDKRWWWPDCVQTGLQSSVQHSYINMDFWIFCHCFLTPINIQMSNETLID